MVPEKVFQESRYDRTGRGLRIVQADITKRQIYELCLAHGKSLILNQLRRRHDIALKSGQPVDTLLQSRTIRELEAMTEQQMQARLNLETWTEVRRLAPAPPKMSREERRESRKRLVVEWLERYRSNQEEFDEDDTDKDQWEEEPGIRGSSNILTSELEPERDDI